MTKVLVVEDDKALAENIKQWLHLQQFVVDVVMDGDDAEHYLKLSQYDVVILDWELPGKTGIEILKNFRASGKHTPVLMLTGKDAIENKEEGLDSGSDDYLTKPFHMKELSARLRALLRRPEQAISGNLTAGDVTLDPFGRHVFKAGKEVELLPKEFALLEFFMRHPGQVFTPEAIVDRVWAATSEVSPESVKTYIARLRTKLDVPGSASIIDTVRGAGYRLGEEAQ